MGSPFRKAAPAKAPGCQITGILVTANPDHERMSLTSTMRSSSLQALAVLTEALEVSEYQQYDSNVDYSIDVLRPGSHTQGQVFQALKYLWS